MSIKNSSECFDCLNNNYTLETLLRLSLRCDENGNFFFATDVGVHPATIIHGQTVVPTAGTAVPLGLPALSGKIRIKALDSNTGIVYIGDASVDASSGYPLIPDVGEFLELELEDLSQLYVDASVNTEKIAFIATIY